MPLRRISVETSPEAEDAVAALLERLFQARPSIYFSHKTRRPVVTVFSTQPARHTAGKSRLLAELKNFRQFGLDPQPAAVSISPVRREDWAKSWKKYFKTIEIGGLLIRPSWSKRKARRGQAVVVLDPGLSFGTGQHSTTRYCLEKIVRHRPRNTKRAFLDAGTGSGILAIAAAKLGYQPVQGLDNDPQAVRIAAANARRNRVESKVRFVRRDICQAPQLRRDSFNLVCANLTSDILIQSAPTLAGSLCRGGLLVIAGVLASEFDRVQRAMERAGLQAVDSRTDGEWRAGTLASPV